jgi:hypothetical protein
MTVGGGAVTPGPGFSTGHEAGVSVSLSEKTRPPMSALRYVSLDHLYAAMPQIADVTQMRPQAEETALAFLLRLRASGTPEEAVTLTVHAVQPKLAIWWAHECLRQVPDALSPLDRDMMEAVGAWIAQPNQPQRHALMREALWATTRSPGVMLALAVGWSGGSVAPNDPAPVPIHRTPKALNTAVLSMLAKVDLRQRPLYLHRFIDVAETLFRM